MNRLSDLSEKWVAVTRQENKRQCPECDDGELEEGYARDPGFQSHWRGVPALVCTNDDCGYAERREG